MIKKGEDSKKIVIDTQIDRMLQIIKDEKSISLRKLAKKLKIRKNTVEHWCLLLERDGLVYLSIPLIGLIKVMSPEYYKEKKSEPFFKKGKGKEKWVKWGLFGLIVALIIAIITIIVLRWIR